MRNYYTSNMKPAILTIILGTGVLLAHVVGWGGTDYDYGTSYGDYMDDYDDYYGDYYDQYNGEKETKCGIKPRRTECPKINAGKCARELLQKQNVKGKRRNKMMKEIKKDLRNHWCSEPRNITNGNVETPCGTGLLQTAKYSCKPGYKLIPKESDKSQCKLNKKWSGKIPVCKSGCGELKSPDNGAVSRSGGAAFNAVAHYSCSKGYRLVGPQSRFCSRTGDWTETTPTCEPIDCGNLTNPENGEVFQIESTYGAEARYTCRRGYRLDGSQSRFCSIEGNWFGTAPKCVQINCGELSDPQFGYVSQTGTTLDHVTTYGCNEGYRLVPAEGNCPRRCLMNGDWSGIKPKCISDCGQLQNPANGTVSLNGTSNGDTATYACDFHFKLTEGNPVRTCQNGSWTGQPAVCNLIGCANLENPQFGFVSHTGTSLETMANYNCDAGYHISGSRARFCLSTGWSGDAPTCIKIECALPESPCNGKIDPVLPEKLDLDSVITYSCHHGYVLEGGSKTRKCTPMGWDGHTPCCVKDFCDPNPCQNGGSCESRKNGYNCDCAPDFSGVNCQIGPNCTCPSGYGGVNCLMENKAFLRPAWQSSERPVNFRNASFAVDGGRSTHNMFCTHTNYTWQPWWMVDLQSLQRVNEVHLLNRRDCCGGRLRNIDVYVSNDTDPTSGDLCWHYPGPAANGELVKLRCCPPLEGRYLRIQADYRGWGRSALTLCEVDVY